MNISEMTAEQIRTEHCSKYRSNNPIDSCVGCPYYKFVGSWKRCTILIWDTKTKTVKKAG